MIKYPENVSELWCAGECTLTSRQDVEGYFSDKDTSCLLLTLCYLGLGPGPEGERPLSSRKAGECAQGLRGEQ